MRILVTGATGFIGSRLLARLSVECDQIRIFRRSKSSPESVKNIKFEDFIGDVTNRDDCMRAAKDCDYAFHLAASVSYWDKLRQEQYDINVNGTKNIVEACLAHKVKRLIHTSSIVAIGCLGSGLHNLLLEQNRKKANYESLTPIPIADEDTEYNLAPLDISYCDTKHQAELEVQKGVAQGLDAVIVNPGAVFGPGDVRRFKGHLYGSIVWTKFFYVGGGIATVDVDDVVEGHIRAWKKGRTGERYILANENLTFREISGVIDDIIACHCACPPAFWRKESRRLAGRRGNLLKIRIPTPIIFLFAHLATWFSKLTGTKPIATIPMAKFTRVNLFFSNEKACKELGLQFKPFRESIERAIGWFQEHNYM
jgi:dihydroflavonol-4-reductase